MHLLTFTPDMTEEERTGILSAPEFHDFVDWSTKIMQRALNDNYDPARGYEDGAESVDDDSEGKRVKRVCTFYDERYGKNRSITDVDWSPKVCSPRSKKLYHGKELISQLVSRTQLRII